MINGTLPNEQESTKAGDLCLQFSPTYDEMVDENGMSFEIISEDSLVQILAMRWQLNGV